MSSNNRVDSNNRQRNDLDRDPDRHNDLDGDPDRHNDPDNDPDRHDDHGVNPHESGKWLSALIALLGLWMIAQAIGLDLAASQFWNDVLVGTLLIGVGGYNYSRRASERFGNTAVALIAVAAGVWLLAAPFVVGADTGFTETSNVFGFYNDLVVGLLAIALGAYSAYKAQDHDEDTRQTRA